MKFYSLPGSIHTVTAKDSSGEQPHADNVDELGR